MPFVIAYPVIDPVLLSIGPLPIRWYALAYIAGLVIGWAYARHLVGRASFWGVRLRPDVGVIDDLLIYTALGVILGGRLGYVVFYNPVFYLSHPLDVFKLWQGGMSFHGGLVGAGVGVMLLARRRGLPTLALGDVVSAVAPIGLFLGRIANFIKPELWGRPTDVAWAMVFPGAGDLPRHPSQLYEAAAEGALLFLFLFVAVRLGALKRPGLVTGLFAIGYGCARIFCEFFREPDPQLGFLFGAATMGMLLSLPLIAAGVALVAFAFRREAVPA
ncbi:prolipoprotein diacylglyceryl transferase [Methylocella silvestris]|uniref:Phosphatidylglycerol--prolipoprotein diacylglyceryl transferase n=1 Tax=Methylocella silvestris TaxID=199596 RepID=A0A2J7TGD7_METSI|nr:prolipoprotein diacylglyceryl transferase [Methylocella silvestris]PNG25841.1 prolipoprotein diacylglyceryl transferase [Methylocella silvestris]